MKIETILIYMKLSWVKSWNEPPVLQIVLPMCVTHLTVGLAQWVIITPVPT